MSDNVAHGPLGKKKMISAQVIPFVHYVFALPYYTHHFISNDLPLTQLE